MPPTSLEDAATADPKRSEASDSSDDDDDFGPALPPTEADQKAQDTENDEAG
ncbi:hypothetical protein KC319_g18483, partial [Hortaea werneckii]